MKKILFLIFLSLGQLQAEDLCYCYGCLYNYPHKKPALYSCESLPDFYDKTKFPNCTCKDHYTSYYTIYKTGDLTCPDPSSDKWTLTERKMTRKVVLGPKQKTCCTYGSVVETANESRDKPADWHWGSCPDV